MCAAFFCAGPALAQVGVTPLLTQPAERLTITQGFRDWIGIALAGPTVISGAPNGKGGLYAIDAATRAVKWTFRPAAPASPMVSTRASIVGNTVLSRFEDGQGAWLIGISLATGNELWRAPTSVPMDNLVLGDGQAFVLLKALDADRRGLRIVSAVDVQTGKERWQVTFKTETGTAPMFLGGMVYIGVAGGDGGLIALDARSGQERWRYRLARDFPSTVLAVDRGVYAGGNWLYGGSRTTRRC
ncbi:MAG: PQQ-binding-like beta-propeller repeat protein [Acidobacteriota bacterium]